MKNILLPTTLEADTINAVKTATMHANCHNCAVVLMIVCNVPDIYSAAYFVKKTLPEFTPAQKNVLARCKEIVAQTSNCVLQIHCQYGVSAPLLKNLIENKGIGLIIIPQSYRQEQQKIHHVCNSLLQNSKCTLLHLEQNCKGKQLIKALYLEKEQNGINLQQVQQIINGKFSFTIISCASVANHPNPAPQLAETIIKNNIDLLVEARRPQKTRYKNRDNVNDTLGLPLLSVYDNAI